MLLAAFKVQAAWGVLGLLLFALNSSCSGSSCSDSTWLWSILLIIGWVIIEVGVGIFVVVAAVRWVLEAADKQSRTKRRP